MNIDYIPSVVELSFTQKSQLVDKLLACPSVKDRGTRQTILDDLKSISIDRSSTDNADVMNIVNACLNYEGALRQLIEAVGFFEKNSLPMQSVNRLLQTFFIEEDIISQDLSQELVTITAGISVSASDVQHMYRRSVGWLSLESGSTEAAEVLSTALENLLQMPVQATKRLPLFTFISLLSRSVSDQTVRDKLTHWLNKAKKKFGVEVSEDPLPEEMISLASSYHLLVKFEPEKFELAAHKPENTFHIEAWFIVYRPNENLNGKPTLECIYHDRKEEVYHPGDALTFFDNLLKTCQGLSADQFTVELFLPFTLLNHALYDVHSWRCDVEFDNTMAIPHKYPLVLRSYDRAYRGKIGARNAWKKNWELFTTLRDKAELNIVKEEQYEKKAADQVVYLEKIPCLAMTFIPPRFDKNLSQHIFKKMMSAGTAVALWPRKRIEAFDEDTIEQAYVSLFRERKLSELPGMILEYRREEPENERSLANILTLFWDNPYLLPKDPALPFDLDTDPVLQFTTPRKG